MKKVFFTIAISLLSTFSISAQIGVTGGFQTFKAETWERFFFENPPGKMYPFNGYNVGIDYWFRLKKRRIEFTPELTYGTFKGDWGIQKAEHRVLGFFFNTSVYPFDLASDCNCPTWSKDGNFFTKGFFIQVAPGVSLFNNKSSNVSSLDTFDGTSYSVGGSVGAGLDFGLSDFLTLTPLARYYYYPSVNWYNSLSSPNSDANIQQFFVGLKVGFRWKQDNQFRRR